MGRGGATTIVSLLLAVTVPVHGGPCEEGGITIEDPGFLEWRIEGCPDKVLYLPVGRGPFSTMLIQRKRNGEWEPKYEFRCEALWDRKSEAYPPRRRAGMHTQWHMVASKFGPRGYEVDPGTYRYFLVYTTVDPSTRPADLVPCGIATSPEFELTAGHQFTSFH